MLDTDVDRVRVDKLREFIEAQMQTAEEDQVEAVDQDRRDVVSEKIGEIEAYENVLSYLATKSGADSQSLVRIRDREQ